MTTEEFCALLKDFRIASGVSISILSKKYGWHRNTIGSYEKDRLCDVDYLIALSIEGNISLDTLLTERVKAGVLQTVSEFHAIDFKFSSLLGYERENRKGVEYFKVETKQYEPLIQEGSIAEVDTREKKTLTNKLVAYRNAKSKVSVCKVLESEGSMVLLSLVPEPKLIEFDENEVEILGVVLSAKQIFDS